MFTGTVSLVYDVFYRMLSHPVILPQIGNVAAESKRKPFCTEGLSDDYNQLLASRGPRGGRLADVMPLDPDRKAYADSLAHDALEFLILHEVAHITFGHCGYVDSLGLPVLMEWNAASANLDPIVRQSLEVSADSFAAITTWIHRLQNPTENEQIKRAKLVRGSEIVVVRELLMFDWVFSVFVMFWMFDQDIDVNNLFTATHPPPPQRALVAMSRVYGMMKRRSKKESQDQFERARLKAFEAAGDGLDVLCEGKFAPKINAYLDLQANGILPRHLKRIKHQWSAIRDDVAKKSHHRFDDWSL